MTIYGVFLMNISYMGAR